MKKKFLRAIRSSRLVARSCLALAATSGVMDAVQAATCESLLTLQLPNTTMNGAQAVAAGTYQPPGSSAAYNNLPAFCRVTATVAPVPGSSIKIEVWLPTASWNGKYQQSGSHGFVGTFYWGEMVPQIQRGYATAISDLGHPAAVGFDVSWAFGYPERIIDWGWRGNHELADKAKLIISAFYGKQQDYAYFNGCSDGGREGMKEAQMFPHDFNGIIIGGVASNTTGAATQLLLDTKNLVNAGIQGTAGAAVMTRIQNAATQACDALDGVTDGVINNPSACTFNPTSMICKPEQDPSTCITAAQAEASKANLKAIVDPVTREWVMSPWSPGSEFEQIRRGWNNGINAYALGVYQIGLQNPTWDGSTFDLHTDLATIRRTLSSVDAKDPDLSPFRAAGGKLIQWHGWADSSFTPGWETRYYDQVVDTVSSGRVADTQDFYRLFMLPDVGHCGTGLGPDNIGGENQTPVSSDPEHDIVSALEAWVERGVSPKKLIATKFVNNLPAQGIAQQRPICPYPSEAVYSGPGDTNNASNFSCSPLTRPSKASVSK